MRKAWIVFLVAIGMAVPATAGASALKHAKAASHASIVRFERHGGRQNADRQNRDELTFPATVAAVTPATATVAGSLTLMVGTQTVVLPLAAGTTLPASIVVGAMVELKVEVEQIAVNQNPVNAGDNDDDDAVNGAPANNGGQVVTITPASSAGTFGASSSSGRGGSGSGDGGGHGGHGGGGDD